MVAGLRKSLAAACRLVSPVGHESRHLGLLGREIGGGVNDPLTGRGSRRLQLDPGALGEGDRTHVGEQFVSGHQLGPCFAASTLAPQPLPEREVASRQIGCRVRFAYRA